MCMACVQVGGYCTVQYFYICKKWCYLQGVFLNIISAHSWVEKAVSHYIMIIPVVKNAYQSSHDHSGMGVY